MKKLLNLPFILAKKVVLFFSSMVKDFFKFLWPYLVRSSKWTWGHTKRLSKAGWHKTVRITKGTKKDMSGKVLLYFGILIGFLLLGVVVLSFIYRFLKKTIGSISLPSQTTSPISPGLLTTIILIVVVVILGAVFWKRVAGWGKTVVAYGRRVPLRKPSLRTALIAIGVIVAIFAGIKMFSWWSNQTSSPWSGKKNDHSWLDQTSRRHRLEYRVQKLKPGVKYEINRADTFRIQLYSPYDTVYFMKEGFEATVHWDMVLDTVENRIRRFNDFDDGKGSGTYYATPNKEMTVDVYKPSSL